VHRFRSAGEVADSPRAADLPQVNLEEPPSLNIEHSIKNPAVAAARFLENVNNKC